MLYLARCRVAHGRRFDEPPERPRTSRQPVSIDLESGPHPLRNQSGPGKDPLVLTVE